ncbi:nicotinate-nucleotide adenylyltransferase [Pantoea sp. Aalb]|uniref:nicotinate-nucleotide adenylyltransferase n=1 Tax=Pantoea sp. Aalb TaxID=2576762 RepID=UPI001329428D|nr:nicotinate-nucleotide adenylyltransferase [Pantoea sp. Aalb]MXP67551.1 nicotinate-nucleotide adenylyltransferase [Pantoea sp. Aalb]
MFKMHALFGGTFDPIHYGHLRSIESLAKQLCLNKITFLPNNIPPHRPNPKANPHQRIEMLRYAITNNRLFDIDTREIFNNTTPSWTVTTLKVLRAELGCKESLGFIVGKDALLTLEKWYDWQELLSLCHLLVCKRPGYTIHMSNINMQKWLHKHIAYNIQQIHQTPAGYIWLADTPCFNISSTEIRNRYYNKLSCTNLLPDSVINYINYVGLYQN